MNELATFYLPHTDGPSNGEVFTMHKSDIITLLNDKYFITQKDIESRQAYQLFIQFLQSLLAYTRLFAACIIDGHNIYIGDGNIGYAKIDMRTNRVEYIRVGSPCPQGGLMQ